VTEPLDCIHGLHILLAKFLGPSAFLILPGLYADWLGLA
jgi:hypothetical protein